MQCTKCNGNKVKRSHPVASCLFVAILLSLIPILGWIIAALLVIFAVVTFFILKSKNAVQLKCLECKHLFLVDYVAYKKWMNNVRSKDV